MFVSAFNTFDTSKDGLVSENEFLQAVLPEIRVPELLPFAQLATLRKNITSKIPFF